MKPSRKILYIALAIISALFFIFILWKIPQWQSDAYRAQLAPEIVQELKPHERVQLERNAADIENSTRLTLAQIIGGLALLSGLYFTYKNIRVNEEGKLTDRFSKAVELLGDKKMDIRLGGIYALERIARDSQKDHWTVMEVLTAFVRENSHKKIQEDNLGKGQKEQKNSWKKFIEKETIKETKEKPREDIQAIMTAISRRKWIKTEKRLLNLQGVNLARCILQRGDLRRAYLSEANLSGANLFVTNLNDANLSGANLHHAYLLGASLKRADLRDADLKNADLRGADLRDADLDGANLRNALLIVANLRDADLRGADLRGANLSEAKYITLNQILSARSFEGMRLSPKLQKELDEWQVKRDK